MLHHAEIAGCSYATIFSFAAIVHGKQKKHISLPAEEIGRILNACKKNNSAAQKELFNIYYGYAMSIALRFSAGYENAIEMVNDAFLKIFMRIESFEPPCKINTASFTAWMKQIMIYSCIDHLRKYNRKEMLVHVDSEQVVIADDRETADQMLHYKEIVGCIQRLSPGYKEVFNLYVVEGFSHAEIAARLNISEGASKSNLHRARQNLQQLLEKKNTISLWYGVTPGMNENQGKIAPAAKLRMTGSKKHPSNSKEFQYT